MDIRDDLLNAPPLIPKEELPENLARFGLHYFDLGKQQQRPSLLKTFIYNVLDTTEQRQKIISAIQNAKPKRSRKPLKSDIEQLLYIAKVVPVFHTFLQFMNILSWLRRRVLGGISDMQEFLKGYGFNLPLVEAWQSDISPFIRITIRDKFINSINVINHGIEREHFIEKIEERILVDKANNLIALSLQSNTPLGMWYAPACDKFNRDPITPTVFIMSEQDSATDNLLRPLHNLTVFESLRIQIASGKGVGCLLYHQYGGSCCGNAGLMWRIYEAGMKAKSIKELNWHPTQWVEPECSKPDRE